MKRIKQLLWPGIMALYGLAIFILVHTDTLKFYIHPKLHVLTILSMVILFVLAYTTAQNNIKKNIVPSLKGTYIVFLIPLLLFAVNSDTDASRHVAAENGLRISATAKTTTQSNSESAQPIVSEAESTIEEDTETESTTVMAEDTDQPSTPDDTETKEISPSTDGAIYLNDNNFVSIIDDMHMNLSNYDGRRITYVGLVYKQEDFEPNQLVVGRLMMYCCAADAQIIGLLSTTDEATKYADGDWVEVTGLIHEKEYKDPYTDYESSIPFIHIDGIRPAREPDDPYVYFNE